MEFEIKSHFEQHLFRRKSRSNQKRIKKELQTCTDQYILSVELEEKPRWFQSINQVGIPVWIIIGNQTNFAPASPKYLH
jgi:hypothetical protein